MDRTIRVFKCKITWHSAEGWETMNPTVFAYHRDDVEYILSNHYPELPLHYSLQIIEIFPTGGTVL